jgi:membrane protease YdiL (CAAX protease family)
MVLTVLFVLVTHRRSPQDFAALRISTSPNGLLLLLLLGISVAILFDLISWVAVDNQELTSAELLDLNASAMDWGGWMVALLFMVLLQPIAEELVFRGVMFPALRVVGGAWTGLLMCAGFQAVFHFMAYPPSPDNQRVLLWYGLILPFLDALFITGVRASTGSTRAAIVAHAALGLFAVLKVYTLSG